jgi:hypothetical protein
MAILWAAYLVALVVRGPDTSWPWIDGWGVVVYEFIAIGLLYARAFSGKGGRALPLVLGSAVLAWSLGDAVLTWESWNGGDAPNPGLADVFYLSFFPLAYAAVVLMLRKELKRLLPATWLDGAIAGLGAAAVCAAFAFNAISQTLGNGISPLAVAVDLAYPIGDVLLLALVVGGTALLPGRRVPWLLFALACLINAVGDTFNLLGSAGTSSALGDISNAVAWPVAILLMS